MFEDFTQARKAKHINRLIQIFLSITLAYLINYLTSFEYSRFDITSNRQYSLSPESIAYLQDIPKPVEVFVTFSVNEEDESTEQIFKDIENLLREYEFISNRYNGEKITYEFIDIFKQRSRAQELATKYNINKDHVIIVTSGENRKEINIQDLYVQENQVITGFKGEELITQAILNVTNDKQQVIYFILGHGEMSLDDVDPRYGLSQLKKHLMQRNMKVLPLDLTKVEKIPSDASMVVVASPQGQFFQFEVEILRNYLSQQNGNIFTLIDTGRKHGLDDLFYDWGILVDDMHIQDPEGVDYNPATGDLILSNYNSHAITDFLITYQLKSLISLPRPVRIDPGAPIDDRRTETELILTSATSWAEKNYRSNAKHVFDSNDDLPGPISIGVISERKNISELGINLKGGRLIVLGTSDFIANQRFLVYGNNILTTNIFNWCLANEKLLHIPPKRVQEYQLVLSNNEFYHLIAYLVILPFIAMLLGFTVYALRKN